MAVSRAQHTATLLNDGRVLIAGGDCGQPPQTMCGGTAEIYDPSTHQFSRTGSMVVGRFNHAATILPDGRVLITGGEGVRQTLTTVEIYDPQAGQFSSQGELKLECRLCFAALLEDGRVVVTGPSPAVQIYDLSARNSMVLELEIGYAAKPIPLPNQRILFAGGFPNRVVIYDLRADTSQRLDSPFQQPRFAGIYDSVTALVDGSVLMTGGAPSGDWSSASNTAILLRPEDGQFVMPSDMPNMQGFRNAHTATALPDGSALLVGGNEGGGMTDLNEIFDPATFRFRRISQARTRASHTATLLPDGMLLIAGGSIQTDYVGLVRNNQATAELYLPDTKIPAARIHSLAGEGGLQGAILHGGSSRAVSKEDPAVAGEVLEIYAGGLAENGKIWPSVSMGGLSCEVLFVGAAPGYPGLFQINVRVPPGIAAGALSVRMRYLDRPSNEVKIWSL